MQVNLQLATNELQNFISKPVHAHGEADTMTELAKHSTGTPAAHRRLPVRLSVLRAR